MGAKNIFDEDKTFFQWNKTSNVQNDKFCIWTVLLYPEENAIV